MCDFRATSVAQVFVRINNNNNDLYFNKLTLSAEIAVIKRGPAHIKNLQ